MFNIIQDGGALNVERVSADTCICIWNVTSNAITGIILLAVRIILRS